jgi:hypothetical protein
MTLTKTSISSTFTALMCGPLEANSLGGLALPLDDQATLAILTDEVETERASFLSSSFIPTNFVATNMTQPTRAASETGEAAAGATSTSDAMKGGFMTRSNLLVTLVASLVLAYGHA